jgi:hypothetical protein
MRRNGVTKIRRRTAGRLTALLLLAALAAACSDDDSPGEGAQDGGSPDGVDAGTSESAQVSEDCPAGTDSLTGYPPEGYGAARSLTVCLYQADDEGTLRATWSAELGAEPAEKVVRAVALGPRADCPAPAARDDQQVLLRVQTENDFGSEPLWHDYLMRLEECASVVDLTESDLRGGPRAVAVTERVLAPWAGEGLGEHVDRDSLPESLASALDR